MASVNSWLSPDVMHALGGTLIHSLWQCLGVAALAAALMAFSRRPSIRYLIAVCALALMLAVPAATLFVLMKSDAPVEAFFPASSGSFVPGVSKIANAPMAAAPSTVRGDNAARTFENFSYVLPSPSVLPWLVGAWLSGVVLFSLRFTGGFLLLEHRRRRQSAVPDPRIMAMCREIQHQLGLDRAIRYLECGWLQAPAVIGWIRPIVLLPVSALTGLSEEQLRAVIAHELAHIRRLDSYVNLFQILVETLLFYHPAMWWLNRRIRVERELCCDEMAVSLTGNRLEYARALTLMAEWKSAPVLAMAANRGPLSGRIFHILGRKSFGARQRVMGLTGGVLFLTAALAAANAVFGIAYSIPIAHASESPRAALSSTQVAAPGQTAGDIGPNQPVANSNPTASGNAVDASKNVAANEAVSAAPASAPTPRTVSIEAPTQSVPAALPQMASVSEPSNKAIADQSTVPTNQAGTCQPVTTLWSRSAFPEPLFTAGMSHIGSGRWP